MFSSPLRLAATVAALAVLPVVAAHAETLTVRRINDAIVMGLSADGKAAVGQLPGSWETFRWTARTGVAPLGRATSPVLGIRSGITRISADGTVVAATVLSDDSLLATAGRWTAAGGWQMLAQPGPADLAPIDNTDSSVFGLSGDGKVVAGLYWRGESWIAHAMRWTSGTGMTDAGSSGYNSRINAVNGDGSVMVGWDEHPDYRNWRATVWVNGARTVLEDSDWFTEATAVNGDGTVVVGQTPDPANGNQMTATMWKWNGASWVKSYLGLLPASKPGKPSSSYPESVSNDGSVVVGSNMVDMSKGKNVGFIWTPATGMLNATDWLAANGVASNPLYPIYDLSAVSADGKVIAAVAAQKVAPFATRSLLIRRAP